MRRWTEARRIGRKDVSINKPSPVEKGAGVASKTDDVLSFCRHALRWALSILFQPEESSSFSSVMYVFCFCECIWLWLTYYDAPGTEKCHSSSFRAPRSKKYIASMSCGMWESRSAAWWVHCAWAARNIIALVSIHALSFIFITVITVCPSSFIRFRDSVIRWICSLLPLAVIIKPYSFWSIRSDGSKI